MLEKLPDVPQSSKYITGLSYKTINYFRALGVKNYILKLPNSGTTVGGENYAPIFHFLCLFV
jgi:hypothetical protein